MTDVLLFCPRADRPFHDKYFSLSPPLGMGYLAKALKAHGISCKLIDCYCTPLSAREIQNLIYDEKPRMIGLLLYTESASTAFHICEIAKSLNHEIVTVVGGPHSTFKTQSFFESCFIDVAVINEGEEVIVNLWREINAKRDFSNIKGIMYVEDGVVIKNNASTPIENLDNYGYPDRKWFPQVETYLAPSTILTSRGCPSTCSFCGSANVLGSKYRVRSISSIIEEAEYLTKIFPNDATIFWDDAFGHDTVRLVELCDAFRRMPMFKWTCGIRVDKVNREVLELMAHSGCVKINFGVESGSQLILDEAKKGITLEQIKQAVKLAGDAGIYNSCSMMIGHPGETHTTAMQSLLFAEELLQSGATSCTFNALVPFPGTFVYENRDELEINIVSERWEDYNFLNPIIETKELNIAQLRKYLIMGLKLWSKYKKNRSGIDRKIYVRDALLSGNLLGRSVH